MTGRWGWTAGYEDGLYRLTWDGAEVAQLVWCQRVVHETVAVERIVAALNRPAGQCAPSPRPTWVAVRRTLDVEEGRQPDVVEYSVAPPQGRGTLVVWWLRTPSNLPGWMQRVVDGLNAGRGLPAVRLAADQPTAPLSGTLEECAA